MFVSALQYMNIYGILMLFSLPAAPIIGVVMDWQQSFGKDFRLIIIFKGSACFVYEIYSHW